MEAEATYPIRAVERLTGLSAATIRAWERRYEAVSPERTEGNARRYSSQEVRRLLLLRKVVEQGHSIASVASLPEPRLNELIDGGRRPKSPAAPAPTPLLREYLATVRSFDARGGADVLAKAAAILTPRDLVFDLLVPLLHEVGALWERGELNVAHEHLVSGQVRWLLSATLRMTTPPRGARRVILATPPDELHEFGVMAGAFLVAARGFEPIYLGPSIPWFDLTVATASASAGLVILSVVRAMDASELRAVREGINQLAESVTVWIGLPDDHPLSRRKLSARLFFDYESLADALHAYR